MYPQLLLKIFLRKIVEISKLTLQLFMLNSKRLGGYTQWVPFSGKAHTIGVLQEHIMVSLKKVLG